MIATSHGTDTTWVRPGPAFDSAHVQLLERLARDDGVEPAVPATLGDPRRRRIVAALSTVDGEIDTTDLAAVIAAGRQDGAPEASIDVLRLRLHHGDLPALDEAGVVEYHPDDQRVEYVGLPAPIERLLREAGR